MIFFGPLSSVFDFVTFGVMLWVFHAGAAEFRSGWFVESLATQTLVIFAIRTRRIPFFRSHPSLPLVLAALACRGRRLVLPATPLAHTLGFSPLPAAFFAALVGMVVGYLVLIELGKRLLLPHRRRSHPGRGAATTRSAHLRRRAARFSTSHADPRTTSHDPCRHRQHDTDVLDRGPHGPRARPRPAAARR